MHLLARIALALASQDLRVRRADEENESDFVPSKPIAMRRLGIFALERIVPASVGERLAQRAGAAVVCVDDCDGGCARGDCYCAKQRHANCGTTYRYDSGLHVSSGRAQVLQNCAGLSRAKSKFPGD